MNRWLRCFCILVVLYSVLNPAWAICENEERAYARVLSERSQPGEGESRARDISKNWYEQCKARSQKENENVVMSAQENLRALQDKTGIGNREMTAALNTSICIVKYCIAGNSNSQTTQALPAQQQAEQDSRVTGPKEDCTLLLQQRPVVPADHIACLRRNVSRERNAASAGGGQSNDGAQQQAAQAQLRATQNQARADQARQGKRKTHDPAAEAHQCVAIDNAGSGNFGAFKNTCSYRVNFDTCNYKPRITQGGFNWSADFDCEKQQIGMHTPGAGVSVAAHNRNTEMVYWFACKAPAMPVDVTFVQGQGLSGRCN